MTATDVDHPAQAQREIPADTFQARLMLARLHAGNLKIRDAAARCGVKHESWSGWERGMTPRDFRDAVEKISEGLGVDRDWLMWGGPLTPEQRRPGRLLTRSERRERAEINKRYQRRAAQVGSPDRPAVPCLTSSPDRQPATSADDNDPMIRAIDAVVLPAADARPTRPRQTGPTPPSDQANRRAGGRRATRLRP